MSHKMDWNTLLLASIAFYHKQLVSTNTAKT